MRRRPAQKAGWAYLVLDGTLIPVDRVAADRPFYSGKHKKHGMNLQVIDSPSGDVCGCPGHCPALRTTRTPSGSGASWPNWKPPTWSPWPTRATRDPRTRASLPGQEQAGISERSQPGSCSAPRPDERANAQLKTRRILRKLRCCPWRVGQLAKAIHVLQIREA